MDNLGYGEQGCYGGGVVRGAPTPPINHLATEGTRLTNFNVEAQCTPSRSAIMTGRFSIRSGTHSVPIGSGLEGLTQWEVTITELLSGVRRVARLVDAPAKLGSPKAFELITDPKEEYPAAAVRNTWNAIPAMKIVDEFEQSLKQYPPIAPGTPDPHTPPKSG